MVHHVLLTRYNLPSSRVENRIRSNDNWLRDRTRLFERYTIPSVRSQVGAGPHWIVYIDPDSPAWFLRYMDGLAAQGVLTPIHRRSVGTEELVEDIRRVVGSTTGPLVTTNLDNDDALASDFSRRVTAVAPGPEGRVAVYITHGLVLRLPDLYLRRDPDNAFCSVREDLSDPVTCWADWHNRLGRQMPVRRLSSGGPGWLQVVHGANVSNIVRGRRVAGAAYREAFGPRLDGSSDPTPGQVVRETLIAWPVRTVRDRLRSLVRTMVVAILGKSGLDAVKNRVVHR